MTEKQDAELTKLTKIFYPETSMRADRKNFKKIQTAAYDSIIEMRGKSQNGMSEEVFNEIWEDAAKKFPGDFLAQKKDIEKAFVGYRAADTIRVKEEKKEAEKKAVLNKEAEEDILDIKEEKHLVPQDVVEKIMTDAKVNNPNDHVAQKEEIENKIKAYEDMSQYFNLESPKK